MWVHVDDDDDMGFPSYRSIVDEPCWRHYITADIQQYIEGLLSDKTVRIRTILSRIQDRHLEVQLRTRDLYNWCDRIEREKKRGYSDIQQFIAQLKESPHVVYYCIRWSGELEDDDGRGQPGGIAGEAVEHSITGNATGPPAVRRPRHVFWIL